MRKKILRNEILEINKEEILVTTIVIKSNKVKLLHHNSVNSVISPLNLFYNTDFREGEVNIAFVIALAFKEISNIGGKLLINNIEIKPKENSQCSGLVKDLVGEVIFGNSIIRINDLIKFLK